MRTKALLGERGVESRGWIMDDIARALAGRQRRATGFWVSGFLGQLPYTVVARYVGAGPRGMAHSGRKMTVHGCW